MPLIQHDNWDVAAVFDAAGNVVQFNTLDPESGFEQEVIEQTHTAGNYQSGTHDRMTLVSLEFDGAEQLHYWRTKHVPVRAVAMARGAHGAAYLWEKPYKLANGTIVPKAVRSDGDSAIRAVLDGYDINPVRANNLAIGQPGNGEMILPLSGIKLTLSGEHSSGFTLKLEAFDYDDVSLGSASDNFSNERGSVELVLPANTWKLKWTVGSATDIALRTGSEHEYING